MLQEIKNQIRLKTIKYYGITPAEADKNQLYKAVAMVIKDMLAQKRIPYRNKYKTQEAKRVYYMCMEFLLGKQLKNNLMNLGLYDEFNTVLKDYGLNVEAVAECEPDPALGNGGLGRLAACYMDALTSLDYNAVGFSLCYEYGLFKQRIIEGTQVELLDVWMPEGEVWLTPRTDKSCIVRLGGHIREVWHDGKLDVIHENYDEIEAVPYDLMISGSDCEAVNILRLWRAKGYLDINTSPSQGQYLESMHENMSTEIISKFLYPSDEHEEGRMLRLTQQYFLVSASLQAIITTHLDTYGSMRDFAEKNAIHLNDTHPALCIPELMRLLIDVYSYSWDDAWKVVVNTFSYTNHTVMPEALEKWDETLFNYKLPRIYAIIQEINRRFCADLWKLYPGDWNRISRMAIIAESKIRMANLSIVGSYKVNGVSQLHSDILQNTIFHDFYKMTPSKFMNITNGITHRRWLCYSNPELAALLDECITPAYRKSPSQLSDFLKFKDDTAVLNRLDEIKHNNKLKFTDFVKEKTGKVINPDSIFDVQIKRLHEYKRQLLNALRIISLYTDLLENPDMNITPQTFIFGAKAAPSYYMAKDIIRLIYFIGEEIDRNPKIREKLRVVFMEDYNVSIAEKLIPAANISEQISLAGKEASGTSNMKFMINGALTIGTMDGANVEIYEAVGDDNIFIFGLSSNEVDEFWKHGYVASNYYHSSERIKRTLDHLNVGFCGISFNNMVQYLLTNYIADPYMCLVDFESYFQTHERMTKAYGDRVNWNKMSLVNIASAGIFAADRSVTEYAEKIWNIEKIK